MFEVELFYLSIKYKVVNIEKIKVEYNLLLNINFFKRGEYKILIIYMFCVKRVFN